MARRSHVTVRWLAAMGAVALASAPSTVKAQEYCVDCKSPDAVYRCVIEHAGRPGVPLKSQCMTAMAHHGKHGACSIKGGTVFDCNGPVVRIDARRPAPQQARSTPPPPPKSDATPSRTPPATTTTPPAAAAKRADQPTSPSAQPTIEPPPTKSDGTPRTVEELAKQVTKSSGKTMEKAGDAIGDTARKTWNCIASVFKSC